MRKARLERLIKAIEAQPDRLFDMYGWGTIKESRDPMECGTAACALGSACFDPFFQRLGLKLVRDEHAYNECNVELCDPKTDKPLLSNLAAARTVFGLTGLEAEYLFLPGSYTRDPKNPPINKKRVIARIRAFIDKGGM